MNNEELREAAHKIEQDLYEGSPICPDRWIDLKGQRHKFVAWGGYDQVTPSGPSFGDLAHEEGSAIAYLYDGKFWRELRGITFGAEMGVRLAGGRTKEDLVSRYTNTAEETFELKVGACVLPRKEEPDDA